jgi:hypothetical protein
MGSKIWAVDMILNDLFRPMTNAYQFKDYETATNFMLQLNQFLVGYGEGIDDLPQPDNIITGIRDKRQPESYYKMYYERYSQPVLKCMGMYIRRVLDQVASQNEFPMVSAS